MTIVRVYMCPCGRFGVRDTAGETATCRACGSDDTDWINTNSEFLRVDLEEALEHLSELEDEDGS